MYVFYMWVYKGSTSINTRAQSGNVFLLVISFQNRINHDLAINKEKFLSASFSAKQRWKNYTPAF